MVSRVVKDLIERKIVRRPNANSSCSIAQRSLNKAVSSCDFRGGPRTDAQRYVRSAPRRRLTLHSILRRIIEGDEPLRSPAAARGRRKAAARCADRRRQVRLDVPVAGAPTRGCTSPRWPISPDRARAALAAYGWPPDAHGARPLRTPLERHDVVTDDAHAAIAAAETEIVIDATGNPAAGIGHALACCQNGKHVVMVNVEADALAGPLLANARATPASSTRSRMGISRR